MKHRNKGDIYIWLTGASLSGIIIIAAVLMYVIVSNGFGIFWPSVVSRIELKDGSVLLGEVTRQELIADRPGQKRTQVKIGNRDLNNADFRWVDNIEIAEITFPDDVVVLERSEYGNFYGFIGGDKIEFEEKYANLTALIEQNLNEKESAEKLFSELDNVSRQIGQTERELQKLNYNNYSASDPRVALLTADKEQLYNSFRNLEKKQSVTRAKLEENKIKFVDILGNNKIIPVNRIVRVILTNRLSFFERFQVYISKIWELLSAEPREANTEGGIFPAIFGTVMMILLMSIVSFPLGVIAAIYLREYARPGITVRLVRIAVNNLAGVPSIVYGVFGLGFFVYGVGAGIDSLFYPERLPEPTFGTGGILWASLTLALLTVPVVIVATEEALSSIHKGVREASVALGATQLQTLVRVVIPMASPGMMTGFILAMARAAGEVAPLMITGVVKLAPALPVDGEFPFFHFERKFMHLGFHIFDIGFQSPNVEAAKPMVYTTTFLLVIIVLCMSSLAIVFRERMKKRYMNKSF